MQDNLATALNEVLVELFLGAPASTSALLFKPRGYDAKQKKYAGGTPALPGCVSGFWRFTLTARLVLERSVRTGQLPRPMSKRCGHVRPLLL
jgi:hypothetical protein